MRKPGMIDAKICIAEVMFPIVRFRKSPILASCVLSRDAN